MVIIFSVIWVPLGLIWYVLTLILTPSCTNLAIWIFLSSYIVILNTILVLVIIGMINLIQEKLEHNRRQRTFYENDLIEVYEKIYDEKFDLEAFLENNKEFVNGFSSYFLRNCFLI